jgi:lantibiotic modifying enzyme
MPADARITALNAPKKAGTTAMLPAQHFSEGLAMLRDIISAIPGPESPEITTASIAAGAAGHALFYAYAIRSGLFEDQRAELSEMMNGHLQGAADRLSSVSHSPFLYEGFSGVAWTMSHLQRMGLLEDGQEICEAVDNAVLDWLNEQQDTMLCELIAGLAGLGVYGLERWSQTGDRSIVEKVVEVLARTTVEHQGFRTWFNPPENTSEYTRDLHPQGSFNLGLSHGIPGALAFLARAAALGVQEAAPLVHSAGDWLLHQRRSYSNGSFFAAQFLDELDEENDGSRLAWCYGDLGVSAALMVSARALQRADWEAAALEVARAAAKREKARVMDGGLCHGAFGNAHLFSRLYRASGEACFLEATRHWAKTGFELRKPGQGLAGFLAWAPGMPDAPAENPWIAESGFLEGVAGIGLALLGLLSPQTPDWDRLLLVDIPVHDGQE